VQQRGLSIEVCLPCAAKAAAAAAALAPATVATRQPANAKLFFTPEAEEVKKEICAVGRKLWLRQFVDGNGGNISFRIGPNEVICTPTLVSKYDLTPDDLSLVDMDGVQIAGKRPRTSEIFMHLEIYKNVPAAKSVVHCHPPHATAYAITGKVPPNNVIPEFEVFVGKVAISPYKTPGTPEFAQTVIPFVRDHNTVLLANHGIVCWADTVTHAEWYAEVLDTYCWTLMNAVQLGVPLSYISEQHSTDLLNIKKKLGLPDARFNAELDCHLALGLRRTAQSGSSGSLGCRCRRAGEGCDRRGSGGARYQVVLAEAPVFACTSSTLEAERKSEVRGGGFSLRKTPPLPHPSKEGQV
jgi:L-fuculose-phosphate aldolase